MDSKSTAVLEVQSGIDDQTSRNDRTRNVAALNSYSCS